jgi:fatty-acyl-CoA synthase
MDNVVLGVGDGDCLEVRGAAVGSGYWPEPAVALGGGVFRTSDLAELIDNRVFLRGRAGDVINVAGRKLHPESVEHALEQHPEPQSCVVFGVPDADRSEKVVAVVRLRGTQSLETLRQHLQAKLPAWQIPKEWWITDELDADARGKTSRSKWRERFLSRPR